jgi:Outer membrane protein beta-barrel domain
MKRRPALKKLAMIALLSAFAAAPAMADNTGTYYVAADVGSATYSNLPGWSNPSVIRIAGGFYFSSVFAVEMGYSMFGDSNYNDPVYGPAVISATSFQLSALAIMPLNSQFDLIGKLGLASNAETYTDASNGYGSWTRGDLLIGLGGQFHVNSQVSVRALFDSYGKFDNFFPPMKATSASLGLVYDFY